jgi:predicted enzyme related to lactoylglutathione lyase
MIRGLHAMFYSSQADEFRAFVRDKLRFPFTDVGRGWLIFDMPEADLGCHPADPDEGAPSGTPNISFYCDDIAATVAELKGRGVEFTRSVEDHGYGLVTYFKAPGEIEIQLYQPKYAKAAKRGPG